MSDSSSTSTTSGISKPCQICQTPTTSKCTGCSNVYYCSQAHQKQDWKKHKTECTNIIQVEDDQFGRYWVASRNIKEGSLILKELPTIVGPLTDSDGLDTCVGCCSTLLPPGTQIPVGIRKSCSKCGWPVCGSACEKLPHHADNECSIFAGSHVPYPPPQVNIDEILRGVPETGGFMPLHEIHVGLQVLRGILIKYKDPTTWDKLMNLQEVNNCTLSSIMPSELEADLLSSAIRSGFFLLGKGLGTSEDWSKLIRILRVNALALSRQEKERPFPSIISGLYLKGSFFTHSCVPNATRGISYSPKFELHVRAATDIKKGEMITICYYQENLVFGTEKRLLKTIKSSGFFCQCRRCIDPTELGTFSSAIKCFKCPTGFMLPKSFHEQNERYCCSSCGDLQDRETINSTISDFHKEISPNESTDLIKDAKKLEGFISYCSGKVLHPNHWLLQEAARGCLIGYEDTWVENEQHLQRFIVHGRKLVELSKILSPGTCFERACLLLKVVQGLKQDVENKEGSLTREEAKKRWMEVNSWCADSLKFWSNDVQNKPNNKEVSVETQALCSMLMESDHKIKLYS